MCLRLSNWTNFVLLIPEYWHKLIYPQHFLITFWTFLNTSLQMFGHILNTLWTLPWHFLKTTLTLSLIFLDFYDTSTMPPWHFLTLPRCFLDIFLTLSSFLKLSLYLLNTFANTFAKSQHFFNTLPTLFQSVNQGESEIIILHQNKLLLFIWMLKKIWKILNLYEYYFFNLR